MHQTSKILFIALLIIQSSSASQEFDINTLNQEDKKTLVRTLAKSFYPTLKYGKSGTFSQKVAEENFYQEVMGNKKDITELVTLDQLKNAFFNAVWLKKPNEIELAQNIISLMINLGVDINSTTDTEKNILMHACQWNVEIVPFLLCNGANVTHVSEDNKTVLHCLFQNSAHHRDINILSELIPLLIDAGVNVNHQYTLTDACHHAPKAVPYLLAADCNIDVVDSKKFAPLQILFNYSTGNFNATRCLLDAGADPTVKNKLGLSLLEIAIYYKNLELTQLLRNADAK